jgi:TRAP-type mannitol/chloroaromatic compound transport system substrate-binding protein
VALTPSALQAAGFDKPAVTIELASTFPGSMPILGDAAHNLSEKVRRASGGEIEIKFLEPDVLVPSADTVNAVSEGRVAAAWAGAGWFADHDSAFSQRRWPPTILVAFDDAWREVVAEESASNPNFKAVYQSYAAFREGYKTWRYLSFLD